MKHTHTHTQWTHILMQTNEEYTFVIVKAAYVKMLFLQAQ